VTLGNAVDRQSQSGVYDMERCRCSIRGPLHDNDGKRIPSQQHPGRQGIMVEKRLWILA
jgi:hypothetical protein